MKRSIILWLAAAVFALNAGAQDKMFRKYTDMQGVEYVSINGSLLNLAGGNIGLSHGSLSALKSLDKLLIFETKEADIVTGQMDKDINSLRGSKDYTEIMSAHDDSEDVVMLFGQKTLVLYTRSCNKGDNGEAACSGSIVLVTGSFTLKDLQKMLQAGK